MTKRTKPKSARKAEHGRHIRFPAHLDEWIDERATVEGFPNASQFLKELVRQAWLKDQSAKGATANAA